MRSAKDCITCDEGTYCPVGSASAIDCSPGTVAPKAGMGTCENCAAGTFQQEAGKTACDACPPGSYCLEGAAAALPCPAGEFSNETGLHGREGCSPCPVGTFCFAGSTAAKSCSKGTYAAAERSQLCNACPEGKYQGDEGASACSECGDGFTCPEGSVVQIPASCDAGTYLDSALQLCLGCPAGSVCAGGASQPRPCNRGGYCMANVSQPTDCPAGSYQNQEGKTECTICGAGNYSANTLSCEPCQVGEFCVAGTLVGVRCPLAHSTTNGQGARSEDDCVCQVGYYMDEDKCVPCQAVGTNCNAVGVGVTVATLPLLADWWRLPNSTQLERCFAISNCTGGSDALQLCGKGYEVELSLRCPLCHS